MASSSKSKGVKATSATVQPPPMPASDEVPTGFERLQPGKATWAPNVLDALTDSGNKEVWLIQLPTGVSGEHLHGLSIDAEKHAAVTIGDKMFTLNDNTAALVCLGGLCFFFLSFFFFFLFLFFSSFFSPHCLTRFPNPQLHGTHAAALCVDDNGHAYTRTFTKFLALAHADPLPPIEAPAIINYCPSQPACVTAADRFQWVPFGAAVPVVSSTSVTASVPATAAVVSSTPAKKAKKAKKEHHHDDDAADVTEQTPKKKRKHEKS
jgi:hypothetical protein